MGPGYKCQAIVMVERFRNVLAEGVASAPRRDAPPAAIVGIRPQEVAHRAFVGHFLHTVERSDLIKGIYGW